MEFDAFSDIVKVMATNCPNWVTTLIGWKRDTDAGDVKISHFGMEGEGLKEEQLDSLREIFGKQWETATEISGRLEEEEVLDHIGEAVEIEVDVEAMEEVTKETEVDMMMEIDQDADMVEALKILGVAQTTINSDSEVPAPKSPSPEFPRTSPATPSPKTSISPHGQHPFDIAVPRSEPETPQATPRLLQTPAVRSYARVTRFLGEAEEDHDDSEEEDADIPLPAPDFFQDYSDGSDSDYKPKRALLKMGLPKRGLPPTDLPKTDLLKTGCPWFWCKWEYNNNPQGRKSLDMHLKRHHSDSITVTDKASGTPVGVFQRDGPKGLLKCSLCNLFDNKGVPSWVPLETHIRTIHNGKNTIQSRFILFPPLPPDDATIPVTMDVSLNANSSNPFLLTTQVSKLPASASASGSGGKASHRQQAPHRTTSITSQKSAKDILKSSTTASLGVQDHLVTTSILKHYGLAFNTLYKLLICMSCAEGFPLTMSLYTHLVRSGSKRTKWNPDLELWATADVVYENHLLGPKAIPRFEQLAKEIVDSLVSEGHIKNGQEIRNIRSSEGDAVWTSPPLPTFIGKIRPQVFGLRVFSKARECSKCDYICPTISSMKVHTSKVHHTGSSSDSNEVTAQTLFEFSSNWVKYFKVSPEGPTPALDTYAEHPNTLDFGNIDLAAGLDLLRRKKTPIINALDIVPDLDVRTVLPVFVGTGVNKFLQPFNRKTLHGTYQPNRHDLRYSTLRSVILRTYRDDLDPLVDLELDPSILHMITNCTPNTKSSRRDFSPLTEKKSVAAYGLLELKFVWALLQSYDLKVKSPNQAFVFNQAQMDALENLVQELDALQDSSEDSSKDTSKESSEHLSKDGSQHSSEGHGEDSSEESSEDTGEVSSDHSSVDGRKRSEASATLMKESDPEALVKAALYRLLNAVYFPQNYRTDSIFDSPPLAFLALQCISEDGSYSSIHLIPPIIAKLQYSFRLRASHEFRSWKGECETDEAFFNKCKEFCDKFLQDFNHAPFAKLRRLLHMTSVISKSTPRPDLIWWQGESVTVGNITVEIPKYKAFLKEKLQETERFVEQHILLSVCTLQEIEKTFNVSKLKEIPEKEDILGNGILLDGRNPTLDNPESGEIFLKMLQQKKLGAQLDATATIKFGRLESAKWIANIDIAMADIQSLCHATEGPGVGRMTEGSLLSPINTLNGARNVVFETAQSTGGFRSGYHKGSFTTGKNKELFRLLPYCVFLLLYVLVRIIRPIELAILFDHFITPGNQQSTVNAYRERIWVSFGRAWTPTRLSNNLQRFMQHGVGVNMGARIYRHFAIAIQRHYPETNYGRYESKPANSILVLAADLIAGHTPAIAEFHYAREQGILDSPTLKAVFIQVCHDWHAFLGFSTSPDDV